MWRRTLCLGVIVFMFQTRGMLLVLPEDVVTGFAAIYGFTPKILKGNDHRFGFGFRFGNHADLQILYEIGPQLTTNSMQPSKARSAGYRERPARRRPVIEFLLRSGFLKEAHKIEYNTNECHDPK